MGRGGPFTALFGFFYILVILLLEAFKWLFVGTVIALILAGRGIRWLYRRHKAGKEMHERPSGPDLTDAPRPYISPVEYRDNDWS